MGGWPSDSEAKKCIRALKKDFGWIYSTNVGKSSHLVGQLTCQEENGCRIGVDGTARNTARALWGLAKKCPHGKAPSRRQW